MRSGVSTPATVAPGQGLGGLTATAGKVGSWPEGAIEALMVALVVFALLLAASAPIGFVFCAITLLYLEEANLRVYSLRRGLTS